jgi:opacity protein-like surface antigen
MNSKNVLLIAASAALAASMALPATAQWHDNHDRGAYNGGSRQAEDVGYRDGQNDGHSDRDHGHSFRPTQDDNYKNADRGYSSSMGSKQSYKDAYRRGYERGYNESYRGGRR